jgi:MinD-like ATPase involved in chromosome partitioning or flagellar assembly
MGHIVSIHSYRGGTGKSNVTANVAWLLARRGRHVAVLDTDLQSPGVHVVLGLEKERITDTLTDFLFGRCELEDAVYDMTAVTGATGRGGTLHLLPSSMRVDAITKIIAEGYDEGALETRLRGLMTNLGLDFLLIDTHPGLNRETMLTTAVSDTLILLIRPDSQDFHGTALVCEVANRLAVPRIYLAANKVTSRLDTEAVKTRIQEAFGHELLGVLGLDEEMASLGSRGLFAARHPAHALTREMEVIADRLDRDLAAAAA